MPTRSGPWPSSPRSSGAATRLAARIWPLDRPRTAERRAVTIYLWHLPLGVLAGALSSRRRRSGGWLTNVVLRLAVVGRSSPSRWPWSVDRRTCGTAPAGRGSRPVGPGPTRPGPCHPDPGPCRAAHRWSRRSAGTGMVVATVGVLAAGLGAMAFNLLARVTTRSSSRSSRSPTLRPTCRSWWTGPPRNRRHRTVDTLSAVPVVGTCTAWRFRGPVLTAAPSRLRVQPPAGCERLQAVIDVGADDARVAFAVRVDDVTVFESGIRSRADQAERIEVNVAQASYVDLVTSSPSGGAVGVWADPHFVCAT